MDAWWESLDRAFAAWTQAIDEAGLTWKYRQVEQGEWNLFAPLDSSSGHQPQTSTSLDAPLPWDHLDTGIDKQWLKADLLRALEAATVPDCSFEGCSHCGVCGADFGHNIVVPPLPIPEFSGHFVPNQNRAQRLRVWFGKLDDLALISHLDLLRLFDRAVRRAAIPITFTGGFHPSPRIAPASALSLGTTSSGEIVDFDLTEAMNVDEFQQKLIAQLPKALPVYQIKTIELQSPSATQLLEKAEYLLAVRCLSEQQVDAPLTIWQSWIEQVLNTPETLVEQTTKSGKTRQVNLRERLFELQLLSPAEVSNFMNQLGQFSARLASETWVGLRYIGSCRSDGTLLRPEHVIQMLEQVTQREFQLLHIHRQQLLLSKDY